jgi:hypothetical protein
MFAVGLMIAVGVLPMRVNPTERALAAEPAGDAELPSPPSRRCGGVTAGAAASS